MNWLAYTITSAALTLETDFRFEPFFFPPEAETVVVIILFWSSWFCLAALLRRAAKPTDLLRGVPAEAEHRRRDGGEGRPRGPRLGAAWPPRVASVPPRGAGRRGAVRRGGAGRRGEAR